MRASSSADIISIINLFLPYCHVTLFLVAACAVVVVPAKHYPKVTFALLFSVRSIWEHLSPHHSAVCCCDSYIFSLYAGGFRLSKHKLQNLVESNDHRGSLPVYIWLTTGASASFDMRVASPLDLLLRRWYDLIVNGRSLLGKLFVLFLFKTKGAADGCLKCGTRQPNASVGLVAVEASQISRYRI